MLYYYAYLVMIKRQLAKKILEASCFFPALTITGPRQSGKTTLARAVFSEYAYVNLENPDTRAAFEEDPRRFLLKFVESGVVIDEAQREPALFSYLQQILDDSKQMGKFILTGSQNFLMLERITQSLAGRVSVFHLLPFDQTELAGSNLLSTDLNSALLRGGYPVLYDRGITPENYFPSYIETYVERDVRSILNVRSLGLFQRFMRLCAGRVGQLFNASSVGNDLGVSYKTVQSWLSILEASFIVFRLSPYFVNFNKRVVKQPKIYFYDTGLLTALLGIRDQEQLDAHYLRGGVFESYIISEFIKQRHHCGLPRDAYFWRDNKGNEIDLLIPKASDFLAVEIKSAETISGSFFNGLKYFTDISNGSAETCFLIYGGSESSERTHGKVLGWKQIPDLLF